jgi:hypothetical protein
MRKIAAKCLSSQLRTIQRALLGYIGTIPGKNFIVISQFVHMKKSFIHDLFIGLIGTIFIFDSAGCSKKIETVTVPATSDTTTNSIPPNADRPSAMATPVAVTIMAAPEGGADLKDLNHAYIRWIMQSHQRPKTYAEFVAASGITVPPAPTGKKYSIDKAGFIAVVDQ